MTYKVLTEVKRKYYKYVSAPWTRPNLFANGTIGSDSFAVKASTEQTAYGRYAWKAVDGDTNTYWFANATSCWIEFYNPNALNVTRIEFRNADAYTPATLELWAGDDENSLTQISATVTTSTNGNIIDCSSNTQFYKIYRIQFPSTRAYGARELNITATQKIAQESTSSDYDFYKDIDTYNSMIFTERKYYKYSYQSWTRPDLTDNGKFYGNSFSVKASSEQTDYEYYAWKAVDGDAATYWYAGSGSNDVWYEIYNPNALCITEIKFKSADAYYSSDVKLYVGNDENSLTEMSNYTYTGQDTYYDTTKYCIFDCSNNTNYYKIYRMVWEQNKIYASAKEFLITATERIATESTSSDYDFYRDVNTGYYAFI